MTLRKYFSGKTQKPAEEAQTRETFTEYIPIEGNRIGYSITRDKNTKEEISRTVPIFFSPADEI